MKPLPYDDPHFLEPAHAHDPVEASGVTGLPQSISGFLPDIVQELLASVQQATSIAFASLNRLDDLLSQRLTRLTVLPDENRVPGGEDVQCKWAFTLYSLLPPLKPLYDIAQSCQTNPQTPLDSEPVYFTYQNQLLSEKQYLVIEALPDWKHKTARLERECRLLGINLDLPSSSSPPPNEAATQSGEGAPLLTFAKWLSDLQDEVLEWKKMAVEVEVPDFGVAVADLVALQQERRRAGGLALDGEGGEEGMEGIEKVDSGIEF